MDTTLISAAKLMDLLQGFKSLENVETCSGAELLKIGEHNVAEYKYLKNIEPDKIMHIKGLGIRLLAKIQPLIIEKYGIVNIETTRQFLVNFFREVETRTNVFETLGTKITDELKPTDDQIQIINCLVKILPDLMVEALVYLIGNSILFPEANSTEIIQALADIAKEAGNANNPGNN